MSFQLSFLNDKKFPEGFHYYPDFISESEERELLKIILDLPFSSFEMHGVEAKRKIIHYGLHYDFLSRSVQKASPLPHWIRGLRGRAETLLEKEISQLLVTSYPPLSGIGWHFDAPSFESLLGVSLLGPCRLQLRKGKARNWMKTEVELEPRSAYVIQGEARWDWQHQIPPIKSQRFSLTFRTIV